MRVVGARRLFKEHKSYVLEEEQQKIKLDKFIADGAEEWDIKNAVSFVLCLRVPCLVLTHPCICSSSRFSGRTAHPPHNP